jgi:hypothetical protein
MDLSTFIVSVFCLIDDRINKERRIRRCCGPHMRVRVRGKHPARSRAVGQRRFCCTRRSIGPHSFRERCSVRGTRGVPLAC